MVAGSKTPETIDEYIAPFPPEVRSILEKIRLTIRRAAPQAEERISYRMPAFTQGGVLVYFAAFKNHIGLYPPLKGHAGLQKAIAPYAGEKGNLRFPLDEPIPYALIARIVRVRVKDNLARERRRPRRQSSGVSPGDRDLAKAAAKKKKAKRR